MTLRKETEQKVPRAECRGRIFILQELSDVRKRQNDTETWHYFL